MIFFQFFLFSFINITNQYLLLLLVVIFLEFFFIVLCSSLFLMKKHRKKSLPQINLLNLLSHFWGYYNCRIVRLKNTGEKSHPKVNECSLKHCSSKGKNGGNMLIGLTAHLPILTQRSLVLWVMMSTFWDWREEGFMLLVHGNHIIHWNAWILNLSKPSYVESV